jgi:isopenicillin N synthase-like dioxygenase
MTIPVIDLGGALQAGQPDAAPVVAVARALREAGMASGFFYAKGHGVPKALIEQQFEVARRFFELPQASKHAISLAHSPAMRGFEGLGEQTLDAKARPDLKESFYCGIAYPPDHPYVRKGYQSYGANQWPQEMPEMAAQCEAYIAAMRTLAQRLMQLMALSLGEEESYFDHTHNNPMITLRLLSYPPHPAGADELTFGAGAHTDWGAITLLAQDNHGGLEVCMPDGNWVAATPMADALVVNLGDMIPRWTNDLFHSNPHRVRNVHSNGQKRYSIPFFYSPDYEASVEPIASCIAQGETPRYAPCSAGEHLHEMYVKTYGLKTQTTTGLGV